MDIKSKMTARLVWTVEHDGACQELSKGDLIDGMKDMIADKIMEDDDGVGLKVSVYFEKYSYTDNCGLLRQRVIDMLEHLDPESLAELEQDLKKED
tara:strand:+ start:252 stop:539 length:288 start_codon:yes stop_codon:yes gene_type:complete